MRTNVVMARGVNPPESRGSAPPPDPTIPRYERLCEFRQTLLDEDALREDYSGRGMYGTTCLAIVSSSKDAMRFMICLAEEIGIDEAMELADRARTDSMGLEVVTYWPGVLLSEEL